MNFGLINKHTVLPNFYDFRKSWLGKEGRTFHSGRLWCYTYACTAPAVLKSKRLLGLSLGATSQRTPFTVSLASCIP